MYNYGITKNTKTITLTATLVTIYVALVTLLVTKVGLPLYNNYKKTESAQKTVNNIATKTEAPSKEDLFKKADYTALHYAGDIKELDTILTDLGKYYMDNLGDVEVLYKSARLVFWVAYSGGDIYDIKTLEFVQTKFLDPAYLNAKDKDYIDLDLTQIKLFILARNFTQAADLIKDSTDKYGDIDELTVLDGELAYWTGNYTRALQLANQALDSQTNITERAQVTALELKAKSSLALSNCASYGDARKILATTYPTSWRLHNYANYFAECTTLYTEAIYWEEEALKLSDFGAGRNTLGYANFREGEHQLSLGNHKKAMEHFFEFDKNYMLRETDFMGNAANLTRLAALGARDLDALELAQKFARESLGYNALDHNANNVVKNYESDKGFISK